MLKVQTFKLGSISVYGESFFVRYTTLLFVTHDDIQTVKYFSHTYSKPKPNKNDYLAEKYI